MNETIEGYIANLIEDAGRQVNFPADLRTLVPEPQREGSSRHALWRIVCDPHFRAAYKDTFLWKSNARSALDSFGKALDKLRLSGPLTEEDEERQCSDFLEWFLSRNLAEEMQTDELRDDASHAEIEEAGVDGETGGDSKEAEDGDGVQGDNIQDNSEEPVQDWYTQDDKFSDGRGKGLEEEISEQEIENRILRETPPGLIRLAKRIGRVGNIGVCSEGAFQTASKSDISGITIGDNLSALLPCEVALLSCPATQTSFYRRFVEKRLQVFASASVSSKPAIHQDGPVIICLDTSGSMKGMKISVAAALTRAVTIIAQRRHRKVMVIKYSDGHSLLAINNIHKQIDELDNYLCSFDGMGNNENGLFQWIFNDILPKEKQFTSADILCVSDFGWTSIEDDTLSLISKAKGNGMLFYGLNIEDDYHENDYQMETVCDSLWRYRNGKCMEMSGR